MKFTVAGTFEGERVEIAWEDGAIDGPAGAVGRVLEAVEFEEVFAFTPTGPTFQAALTPAEIAVPTIVACLDFDEVELRGELPELPDFPIEDGATP